MLNTKYPPQLKPILIFDGDCGFCRYWLVKWKKLSREHYDYQPYQSVYEQFGDIPLANFQKAVHLIFPDGRVLSGAAVAYYPYFQFGSAKFLYKWYCNFGLFKMLSDSAYQIVAKHRNAFFRLSKLLFGKDPYKNGLTILVWRLLALISISLAVFYLNNTLLQ